MSYFRRYRIKAGDKTREEATKFITEMLPNEKTLINLFTTLIMPDSRSSEPGPFIPPSPI